jgi:hypothetical protein
MKYFGFRPSDSSHTPDRYVWLINCSINHAEKLENSRSSSRHLTQRILSSLRSDVNRHQQNSESIECCRFKSSDMIIVSSVSSTGYCNDAIQLYFSCFSRITPWPVSICIFARIFDRSTLSDHHLACQCLCHFQQKALVKSSLVRLLAAGSHPHESCPDLQLERLILYRPGRLYRVKKYGLMRDRTIKWIAGHHLNPKPKRCSEKMKSISEGDRNCFGNMR